MKEAEAANMAVPAAKPRIWTKPSGITLLAVAGFLLSLIHLFRQLEGSTPDTLNSWLNSDTLWLANVFTDVFHDHYSLSGWAFAIVSYWFPDLSSAGIFW